MNSRITAALFALAATLTAAAPTELSLRQPGVEWHAVGNLYSGEGCSSQSLIFSDPVWGAANQCHPVDRFNDQAPVISYKTLSTSPGCNVTLFYDTACSVPVGGFAAPVNGCVQGNSPFESVYVTCPPGT